MKPDMQNRRTFLKQQLKRLAALGLLPPLMPLTACGGNSSNSSDSTNVQTNSVIVVGAGAAGMTAALHLQSKGIECTILEASSKVGGRMRIDQNFADFPIPLGAEWLHVGESVLEEASGKTLADLGIETQGYRSSDTYGWWDGNTLTQEAISSTEVTDRKFKNSSWQQFFEQHLLPSIEDKIRFNTQVTAIDYQGSSVNVSTADGGHYTADRVIMTLPLRALKDEVVRFNPALPNNKQDAIAESRIWQGFKAFMKFPDAFYPTFLELAEYESQDGEFLFYDVAYGHDGSDHVLGCFCIGEPASDFIGLNEAQLKDALLNKLDDIFDGKPSREIQDFIHMNWSKESPYLGTYIYDNENYRRVQTLSASLDDRIFFAGEAYTNGDDWGGVHDAIRSALRVVSRFAPA